jgi:hypothetical protein
MQNRYVGDIGDFGKYGLLRALCHPSGGNKLRLGVVWYLVPDESHNEDGRFVGYLEPTAENERRFRQCDPPLYDSLSKIVRKGDRCVRHIQNSSALPPDTRYHDEYLSYDGMPSNGSVAREKRIAHRADWVDRAVEATAGCDVVFVDPDNGLEVKTKRHEKDGPKYVYFDELTPHLERGQSLIIYHHICHKETAEDQVQARFLLLKKYLGVGEGVFALRFHRGSPRVFFVIPSNAHKAILLDRAKQFVDVYWERHFSLLRQNLGIK